MLSQQSCTELVVRLTANVALKEAIKTNSSMVHCTSLAQANSARAVNGGHFFPWFRIALRYSSRVEKRQSSMPGW